MSNITQILLNAIGSPGHRIVVEQLNAQLADLWRDGDREPEMPDYWALKDISDPAEAWGGSKHPATLWGGALNWLPFGDFARIVASLPWESPEEVQVMVMFEEDFTYRTLTLDDLRAWPGA